MHVPKFLTDKGYNPPVDVNPQLNFIGTETAFGFGALVAQIEKTGKFPQVYKFHIGDTGPKTPEPIIEVAKQALTDKQTKYAPFLGFPEVRENIAKHLTKTRGVEIKKENIMLQPGGKPAIELSIQALVGPDDYIIGQNPGFPIYESLARFYTNGERYIPWLAHRNEEKKILEFRVEDLEKILTEGKKIKLLIINTPQNPTGMTIGREKLEAIAELAKKYNFVVLFDDIYDQIIFGERKHFSLLSIPGMLDRTINLSGYSKNFAMTGWRLGYIVAPEWLMEIFGLMAINKWSCVSRVNQIVAGSVFGPLEIDGFKYPDLSEVLDPLVQKDVIEYEKKGNFLVESLRLLSPYVVPNEVEGAFYDFPNIENVLNLSYVKNDLNIKNDKEFCKWMLFERGFACLAGSDFGEGGRGYVRLSYAEDRDKHIIPGVKHFMKVIIELVEKSGQKAPLRVEEVDLKVDEIKNKYF